MALCPRKNLFLSLTSFSLLHKKYKYKPSDFIHSHLSAQSSVGQRPTMTLTESSAWVITGWNHSVGRVGDSCPGSGLSSMLSGRIHLLAVGGLRSSFSFQLSARDHMQHWWLSAVILPLCPPQAAQKVVAHFLQTSQITSVCFLFCNQPEKTVFLFFF